MVNPLPPGLKTNRVYSIPNYAVIFEFISYESSDLDTLVIHRQGGPSASVVSVELKVPETDSAAIFLSTKLGVDESIRKYLIESSNPGIKGVVVENHVDGILCILQKAISGISGKDGMIRTVEHLYSIPTSDPARGITITPLYYQDDLDQDPQLIYDISVDYMTSVMTNIKSINDKVLERLFEQYEDVRMITELLGTRLENINDKYYNQLKVGNMWGVLSNEDYMGKLGSSLELLVNVIKKVAIAAEK